MDSAPMPTMICPDCQVPVEIDVTESFGPVVVATLTCPECHREGRLEMQAMTSEPPQRRRRDLVLVAVVSMVLVMVGFLVGQSFVLAIQGDEVSRFSAPVNALCFVLLAFALRAVWRRQ